MPRTNHLKVSFLGRSPTSNRPLSTLPRTPWNLISRLSRDWRNWRRLIGIFSRIRMSRPKKSKWTNKTTTSCLLRKCPRPWTNHLSPSRSKRRNSTTTFRPIDSELSSRMRTKPDNSSKNHVTRTAWSMPFSRKSRSRTPISISSSESLSAGDFLLLSRQLHL